MFIVERNVLYVICKCDEEESHGGIYIVLFLEVQTLREASML
jgi:hypothetical protein